MTATPHCLLFFLLVMILGLVNGAVVPRQVDEDDEPAESDIKLSPDNKCGPQAGGSVYRCPDSSPCCSPIGYCVGSVDTYCMIETGCQRLFSAEGSAFCSLSNLDKVVPRKAACGINQNGEQLGICPYEGKTQCCAASGICGQDAFHCSVSLGCQAGYGICWDESPGISPTTTTTTVTTTTTTTITTIAENPPFVTVLPPQMDTPVPSMPSMGSEEPPSGDDDGYGDDYDPSFDP